MLNYPNTTSKYKLTKHIPQFSPPVFEGTVAGLAWSENNHTPPVTLHGVVGNPQTAVAQKKPKKE